MPRQHLPLLTTAVALILATSAQAHDDLRFGSNKPGKPHPIPHTHERAGFPLEPAHHVQPTVAPGFRPGFTGGGGPIHPANARGRSRIEGTWGWDYVGTHLPRRIFIPWHRHPRYQGGTGRYQTDYPVEISDIPSALRNPSSPPGSILEEKHE